MSKTTHPGRAACRRRPQPLHTPGLLAAVALAAGLIAHSATAQVFGDGSNGSVTIATTQTLTADMNYVDLTVSAGVTLNTGGYIVRVQGTLTNNGTITDATSGGAGGNGGFGGFGGTGFGPHIPPQTGQGGFGGGAPALTGAGVGGNGGGGGGGGGGAWDSDHDEAVAGGMGGNGGIGGKGGGLVRIFAQNFANLGVIHANGFNGNPGTPGGSGQYLLYDPGIFFDDRDMAGGGGGGGAGGNGGNGGTVQVYYGTLVAAGTIVAVGGAGGPARPGGPGANTTESAGSSQHLENGALGGGMPLGGQGGLAQIGIGSSSPGGGGNPGSPGATGTVVVAAVGCCVARVGDANGNGDDEPTVGDISALIDAKFITGACDGIIDCFAEADINQSGGTGPDCEDITIGDITVLIDYLFITGPTLGLPACL